MLKNSLKILFTLFLLFQSTLTIAQQPNDCVNAITVFCDLDIVSNVSGTGNNNNEFPDSCQSNETNSLWLEVTVTTTGTLAFTLTPNSNAISEDYDFFIFGPNRSCGNLGSAIRCSTTNPQASGQSNNLTGLNITETDATEGPGGAGNSFVSAINANAGDSYFIVIDRPIGNSPFSLEWTGTAQFSEAPTSETDPSGGALNLTECDAIAPFNDGQTPFNLETNTSLIIGTQTDVTVEYYQNQSDANIGTNPLRSPYTSTNNGQTIYATITNTTTGCFSIQEFELFVNNSPTITMPPNMVVCDDISNNEEGDFNLELQTSLVLGTQNPPDFNVTYHLNLVDADTGTGDLTSPYSNISNPQTIVARMESVSNPDCFSTTTFQLIIDPTPIINNPPNMELCDNDAVALFDLESQTANVLGSQNPADFTVTYYETASDANSGTNALASPFPNASNPDEIFIRITPNTGNITCFNTSTTSFSLTVNPQPSTTIIPDLEICDIDNNGFTEFDLTSQSTALINGQPDIVVNYFEDLADANTGLNAISNPTTYTNIDINMQEVFVQLLNTVTNCFATTSFNIVAIASPITITIPDYAICDNANDGDDTNGFVEFNLTTQDAVLINGQPNTTATYFEDITNAQNNVSPIPSPTTYTNTTVNTQIIYVRLDNTVTSCFSVTQFNILVNELPEVQNATLVQCDEDGIPDGFTDYNLNEANQNVMVSGDTTGFIYTHHLNITDAQNGSSAVTPSPFRNTANPQTIHVRIENATTGCFRTAEYVLEVTATDIGDAGLTACDDDYDGRVEFTLSDADATILATLPPGLNVDYYATETDAQLEINQLPNLYTNTTPDLQTIFIRVENANECFGIANMDLTVNPLPENNTVNNIQFCSDTANVSSIDLTQFDTEILGTQNAADFTINYYETQTNANNNVNALTSPYTNTSNPQALFVSIENNTTGCLITTINFSITINVNPIPVDPTPLVVCDDDTPDGMTLIDLSLKNNEIIGSNTSYLVSYYNTLADALAPTGALPIPNYIGTSGETVFVRVEDASTGCFDTTTLELVVEQAPIAFTPTPLEYCDPDSDGFGEFTLSDATSEITGGDTTLIVSYHETMSDAENNLLMLSSPYNNIVSNTQTIYVRVESANIATDCATFVALVLIVNPTPQIITAANLEPLAVCDNDADGFAFFDLTTKEPEILNLLDADTTNDLDPTLYTITYYEIEADANVPNNSITTPNSYTNTTIAMQTIWVRVEDNATGCYKTVALDLIVNPLPILVQPDPLVLCDINNPGDEQEAFTLEDANAQILGNQTGISLSYFSTQSGADTNDGTLEITSPYTNTSNAQTIYVRATDNVTGCVNTITLDLRVNPLPTPVSMPVSLEACDDDNDGFYNMFNLNSQSALIANGEPNISISYYETQADAQSMTNSLTSPYRNLDANQQTIYVLAENDLTGCFTIVTMDLVVLPSPVLPIVIDDYVVCDDDSNSFSQFDFDLVITPQIFTNGQTPLNFNLTYHTSQADADSGNNPIINTNNYGNLSDPQTIYIRLESITNGCVTTKSFVIRVDTPPVIASNYDNELTQCDDLDGNYMEANDGITNFDLTTEDLEITGPISTSLVVTYYENNADAQLGTNAIADPTNYTNTTSGSQTVYVKVTDLDTGCSSFTTVTIRVLPNPSPSPNPMDLELCDDIAITGTNDLLEVFNLTQNEAFIINGELGVSTSYYITQEDALMATNAIIDPTMHINEDPNTGVAITPQTIYVRVTNGLNPTGTSGTGCYSLVNFDIIVNPLPVVTPVNDYVICEFMTDDVSEDFDFTTMTGAILNGQDPVIFTVTYHETQAEADAGINDLTTAGLYTNTSDPQTIYVNITNTVTGCNTSVLTFNLRVDEEALANSDGIPILYEVCDDTMEFDGDTTNDMAAFDLTTQNSAVLDGQDPISYTVSYYANQADADAGINALPFNYTNTVNPQVIIVRVDNNTIGAAPISLDLSTVAAPGLDVNGDGVIDTIDTNGDGVFDIVDSDGDGIAEGFDIEPDGIIDYIDLDGDGNGDLVDLDGDGINDNSFDTSMCYETAQVTLQVNPIPSFRLRAEYLLCINTNGSEILNSPIIDTGLDPLQYTFEWRLDGIVLLGETGSSIVPTSGGVYSVIATNIATGCSNTNVLVSTTVIVSEPPVVTADVTTLAFANQHDITVTATGTTTTSIAVYEFSIDNGSWEVNTPNDSSYTFTDVGAGEHTITVRDTIGCGETTITITVMDYPLYFTPNGDGYHDTWNIYGISRQFDAKIYIFDRFGKLLKQLNPTGPGWDGTYTGSLMPTSDYWFTVDYREPSTDERKQFKGHFTLKR